MSSTVVRRPVTLEQAAAMPRNLWLAGALGPFRRDQAVIRWVSQAHRLLEVPAGVRWDAAVLPRPVGVSLLARLTSGVARERVGPVLLDERTELTYWLTPLDSTLAVSSCQDVRILAPGAHLAVSDPDHVCPSDCDAGDREPVTWAHWPSTNGILTPLGLLTSALRRPRPVDVFSRCARPHFAPSCPRRGVHAGRPCCPPHPRRG
jgi:hypothetical protein